MKKEKFDLIFSLGAACPTSMLLRKHRLQKFSYPLDWMGGCFPFQKRVRLLCTRFQDFLNEKDLEDKEKFYMDRGGKKRLVYNKRTGILFNHDFSGDKSLHEDFPFIFEKYQRRIHRLMQAIEKSQKILVVFQEYANDPHPVKDNQELVEIYRQLGQAFPYKQWSVLYFSYHSEMNPTDRVEERLSPYITKISANYKSVKPGDAEWAVNENLLNPIYKKLRLKKDCPTIVKESLIMAGASLIPFRGIKRKFLGKFFKNYFEV